MGVLASFAVLPLLVMGEIGGQLSNSSTATLSKKAEIRLRKERSSRDSDAPDRGDDPADVAAIKAAGVRYRLSPTGDVLQINADVSLRHEIDWMPHLRGLRHLERLRMPRGTSDAELRHIRGNSSLIGLAITQSSVTDKGLSSLSELTNLESLNLRESRLITGIGLSNIQNLKSLETLLLASTNLDDAGSRTIGAFGGLRRLDLGDTRISDQALEEIVKIRTLWELNLSGTKITDRGLRHLTNLDRVVSLDVSKTAITDHGLTEIAKLTSLINLALTGTNVSDAGLRELVPLVKLGILDTKGTRISEGAIERLRQMQGK